MNKRLIKLPILAALAFTACAPSTTSPHQLLNREAGSRLKQASSQSLSSEQRAVLYLDSARDASRLLGSSEVGAEAAAIYNRVAADLTALLRSAEQGRMWKRPLTLTSGTTTYRLKYAKASRDGIWDPAYFTGMTPADQIPDGDLDRRNLQAGIGGTLVGNHKPAILPPHVRSAGINAAVTATLDFKGNEVLLTLLDPTVRKTADVGGVARTLAADYSAPLAAYPQGSELWNGVMATLRVDQHMKNTGLFMARPYDPERIPVIFVHGLASTPRMWRRVINELETDPEFRRRYQCWLFSYPTGNPPAYSAMRLRQELASVERAYPRSRPYVLIGHSMGGLLSRMQVATVKREYWNKVLGPDKTARFFAKVKPGDIVDQSTRYEANRHIDRVIFICTPHRGSEMAVGSIGELAARLIALPVSLTTTFAQTVGDSVTIITGDPKRMPNSVTGLSPRSPTLKMLDTVPITAPHHSIIGDRGKGDTPNSSDGVVKYWSSHLKSAQSELIVPGPHGACEMPETIAEIRRILHQYCGKPSGFR